MRTATNQLFNRLEEDDDDGDVVRRAVVFGQLDELLTDQVKIIWKRQQMDKSIIRPLEETASSNQNCGPN